jgi:hypothetical protein
MDVPQLVKMADIAIVSSKYEGFSLLTAIEGNGGEASYQRVML